MKRSRSRFDILIHCIFLVCICTLGLMCIMGSGGGGGGGGGGQSNPGTTAYTPVPSLSPMPAGERILYVKRTLVLDTPLWELYSMTPDGGDVLRHSQIAPNGFSISMPEIVPTGKAVTFTSNYKTWFSSFYEDIFERDFLPGF